MFTLFHNELARAACAAVVTAPLALAGPEAWASGLQTSCKSYQPIQAISEVLGSKSAFAYFVNSGGACSVVLMVSEKFDPDGAATPSAARLRLNVASGESVSLDSEDAGSLNIECGPGASTLRVTTGPREAIIALEQKAGPSLCALDAAK
jgi:hypothetical protein